MIRAEQSKIRDIVHSDVSDSSTRDNLREFDQNANKAVTEMRGLNDAAGLPPGFPNIEVQARKDLYCVSRPSRGPEIEKQTGEKRLQDVISSNPNLDEQARKNLLKNMDVLKARMGTSGATEVARTFEAVARLLDKNNTPGALGLEENTNLARLIMFNAARPEKIEQGFHNTCNVASLEVRTYKLYPSAAARMVVDVALTGKYKTTNGFVITVDNDWLKKDQEARVWPTTDKTERNHASQIFQIAAVNVYWQQSTVTPQADGEGAHFVEPGTIKYLQIPVTEEMKKAGDTGERIGFTLRPGTRFEDKNELKTAGPHLSMDNCAEISEAITGKKEVMMLSRPFEKSEFSKLFEGATNPAIESVKNQKELEEFLQKVHRGDNYRMEGKEGKYTFPVIVCINTGNPPYNVKDKISAGAHVVNIVGYTPANGDKPAMVDIDNTWGPSYDRRHAVAELWSLMER